MIIKVTVSHDLYVEADDLDQALQAVKDDYKMGTYSCHARVMLDDSAYKAEFKVDPKTKELISL